MVRLSTKEKIVNASLELFSEKGYKATTIKEIAEKVKVKELTVYRHFGKKINILEQINTMISSPLAPIADYLKNEVVYDLEQDLFNIITLFEREIYQNKYLVKFILREDMTKFVIPEQYMKGEFLVNYFNTMIEKEKMRPFDTKSLTLLFISNGLILFLIKDQFQNEGISSLITSEKYKKTVVGLFIAGLKLNEKDS
ncbi:TetR/AcrR family transcriptional regulator [Jeotgalibacillus marinus]|uniref:TetR/AcrR family transcriptional regulator n=1 Tax=Jeotgalibacillus marinus TaxID=86667 RepID=A0ABV3Q617_9BACL